MEENRPLGKEDYVEPRCVLCGDPYGAAPKVMPVPQQRIREFLRGLRVFLRVLRKHVWFLLFRKRFQKAPVLILFFRLRILLFSLHR